MPQHASFMDVVDGYERKGEQDGKHLAALEGLLETLCLGESLSAAPSIWRGMAMGLRDQGVTRVSTICDEIADAIERVAKESPGVLSFPVSETAPMREGPS